MKKTLILAAVAAFALSSCSKDTPADPAGSSANLGEEISVRAVINKSNDDPNTRAIHSNNTLNNFTLYAKTWIANTSGVKGTGFNFMDFFTAARLQNIIDPLPAVAQYRYYPLKHYPSTAGEGVSFFAYSPAGSPAISGGALTQPYAVAGTSAPTSGSTLFGATSAMRFDYTVPTEYTPNGRNQEDFLVAAFCQSSATGGPITLNFKHALSSISFAAQNESTGTGFVVYKIELVNFDNVATMTLRPNGVVGSTTGSPIISWSANANFSQTYVVQLASGGVYCPPKLIDGTITKVDVTSPEQQLMMLPQDFSGRIKTPQVVYPVDETPTDISLGNNFYSYIKITFSYFEGDMNLAPTQHFLYLDMPGGGSSGYPTDFLRNNKYKYTYKFNDTQAGSPISIGSVGFEVWSDNPATGN